jgi:hypothetical protein
MGFAFQVASGEFRGITPDLDRAQALMLQMGLPEPTLEQIELSQSLAAAAARAEDEMMAGDEGMLAEEQVTQDKEMAAGEDTSAMAGEASAKAEGPKYTAQQVIVATMLGSPKFQKR